MNDVGIPYFAPALDRSRLMHGIVSVKAVKVTFSVFGKVPSACTAQLLPG